MPNDSQFWRAVESHADLNSNRRPSAERRLTLKKSQICSYYKLFAKKLRYHLGADFTYNTPFFARDYAPDLQQFHLQNQTKYSFPILFQPFFSCNLKRFDFMVKINNASVK